jgi:CRP-like cAMP-binding protein
MGWRRRAAVVAGAVVVWPPAVSLQDSSNMMTNKVRVQDFLGRHPLFQELAPSELDELAFGTTEVHIARGDMLVHRGEPCVGLHTVVYGQIKLMVVSPAGDEKVVRIIGPGDSFGEALMLLEKDYIVSAQALVDTMLLHVGRDVVFQQIDSRPGFARKMLASLSQRLHALMSDVEAYSLRSGTQRVIEFMLNNAVTENGERIRLPTSKTVIASRLNLTPEHFSRILHELAVKGLIRVKGRDITILNPAGLRASQG